MMKKGVAANKGNNPFAKDGEEGGGSGQEDNNEQEVVEQDELADQLEAAMARRGNNIWVTGGPVKDAAIRMLIQCFSSMIESIPKDGAIPDHRGRYRPEDMMHKKLLDSSKQVVKAKRVLLRNENFDTRDFTIFIAGKKWVKNILNPLLSLCAKEDSTLAMNCCSLALVLIKKISEKTTKAVVQARKKKSKKVSPEGGDGADSGGEGAQNMGVNNDDARVVSNYREQVSALLSFKEALCSESCNEAITNAFREYWMKEQQETNEDNKLGVAICLSYFRRILAISAHPDWSSPNEVISHKAIHDKFIVQLRVLLSLIPGIISDIRRSYHDDWLADVMLIIYYIVQSFEAQDLYLVWKTNGLMENFATLIDEDLSLDEEEDTAEGEKKNDAETALSQKVAEKVSKLATTNTNKTAPVQVPAKLQQHFQQQSLGGQGSLSKMLASERANRMNATIAAGANNRFGGRHAATYRVVVNNPIEFAAPTIADLSPSVPSSTIPSGGDFAANVVATAANAAMAANTTPLTGAALTKAVRMIGVTTTGKTKTQNSLFVRNPFQTTAESIPQAKTKRNKKNITFKTENPILNNALAHSNITGISQQACVVVSSLVELLTNEACLKSFVRRVNEDLRRDELRINSEMELQYFTILTKFLAYNRLKLEDQYKSFQTRKAERETEKLNGNHNNNNDNEEEEEEQWKPDLINVIDTLDRMSFTRVTFAMERLMKNEALHAHEMHIPIGLFTEMISYLRILLESSVEGHHEIAIGALHRLYYATTERLDPLPRLLTAWKSGLYPRKHLNILIELFHQTMRTLETSQQLFVLKGIHNDESFQQYRLKKNTINNKKISKKEMDMEQYLLAAYKFNPLEYFKRLISNHVIRIYTRLLSYIDSNDNIINERIYLFLQRICQFYIEDVALTSYYHTTTDRDRYSDVISNTINNTNMILDSPHNNNGSNSSNITAIGSGKVHLGYMLFNLQTFIVFNNILSNDSIVYNDTLSPLIRLIRNIIRQFHQLASVNRMMYLELLFMHTRPHDHCLSMHSVYEAGLYAVGVRHRERESEQMIHNKSSYSQHDRHDHNDSSSDSESHHSDDDNNSDDDDAEDEVFDDAKMDAAMLELRARRQQEKQQEIALKKKIRKLKQKERKRNKEREEEEREEGEGESSADSEAEKNNDEKKKKERIEQRNQRVNKRKPWTIEEDEVLRKLYKIYAGTRSVFVSIAHSDELRAFGTVRTEEQISRRVMELQLHLGLDQEREHDLEVATQEQQGLLGSPSGGFTTGDSQSQHRSPFEARISREGDEEDLADFEKRALALEKAIAERTGVSVGDNDSEDGGERKSASSNKRILKKSVSLKKKRRTSGGNDSDDDDMFGGEEMAVAGESVETMTQVAPVIQHSGSRKMNLDSDDDDE